MGPFRKPQNVTKSMKSSAVGPMILLVKGPSYAPEGNVLVVHNGIVVANDKIFDITVTNHFVKKDMFEKTELADAAAMGQSKTNFESIIKKIQLYGKPIIK